jgi:hypothetical protein
MRYGITREKIYPTSGFLRGMRDLEDVPASVSDVLRRHLNVAVADILNINDGVVLDVLRNRVLHESLQALNPSKLIENGRG